MATFALCQAEFLELSRTLSADIGRDVVADITIAEPAAPLDELHFIKLVAWAYVVLVEAMPVPVRQISQTMRASDTVRHKSFSHTRELVEALRTVQSHNMGASSPRNLHQIKTCKIWLQQNAGSPTVWSSACSAMAAEVLAALVALRTTFDTVVSKPADRGAFIDSIRTALEKDWPAHSFDEVVCSCAAGLGLEHLDAVAYRKPRFEQWKQLAALFPDRESALAAVRRAICTEMISVFGRP